MEKQGDAELSRICKQVFQHTEAAQDEQVHIQEEMEKMHQVFHGSLEADKEERSKSEVKIQQMTVHKDQQITSGSKMVPKSIIGRSIDQLLSGRSIARLRAIPFGKLSL